MTDQAARRRGPASARHHGNQPTNAFVTWIACEQPWRLEEELIGRLVLPLNLQGNSRHPYSAVLSACRVAARRSALELPIEA
jgi:hypothetical protein